MKVTVELYREQVAVIEVDTNDYPDETEGWGSLPDDELRSAAEQSAWECVEPMDWQDVDEGVNRFKVER